MNRVLVLSSFLVNFFLLNLFLSLLFFAGFLALQHFCPSRSSRYRGHLLFYSLSLPPVLAWVTLFASFIPPFLILEDHHLNPHFHISHPYHHLCFFHSPISLPSSLIFRSLLIASLFLILFSLFRSLYSRWEKRGCLGWLIKNSLILPEVEALPPQTQSLLQEFREAERVKLDLISSHFPVSFLSGIFHPQVILSTGLLRILSLGQLKALLQHEIAHHIRLDNLTQLILSICRNLLFISPTGHLLFRWWKQEAELLCDEIAIYRTGRPLDLAEALLRMKRAMIDAKALGIQAHLSSAFFGPFTSASIERRMRNILSFCDQDLARPDLSCPRSSPLLGLVGFATISFFLLCLLEIWIDPLILHCQMERIIRFLV